MEEKKSIKEDFTRTQKPVTSAKEMALWMEKGSEPLTETEKADLEAIAALKESAAFEFKVC